jgi:hypothetical protein
MFMPLAAILLTAGIAGTSVTLTGNSSSAPEPRTAAVSAPAPERAVESGVFLAAND